jgi:hypothetical protein
MAVAKIGKGQTKDKKHPSIQAAQVQRAYPKPNHGQHKLNP